MDPLAFDSAPASRGRILQPGFSMSVEREAEVKQCLSPHTALAQCLGTQIGKNDLKNGYGAF